MPNQPMASNTPEFPQTGQERFLLTFGGGLNDNYTQQIQEASDGYNFDLNVRSTQLIPRAPFDKKGTAPNASPVTGIMQLFKRDNTQTTLVAAGNTVYQWDGTLTGFTSKGTITAGGKLRDTYWALGEFLVITDVTLTNVVHQWDGTTLSNMTTGLGTPLYAKYAIVHLNRVWFFNIYDGSTKYPHMVLASYFENPNSLDITKRGGPTGLGGATFTTGLEAFYLLTPNLKAINGVAVFQNTLIISTENGVLYQLTGNSSSTYTFTDFFAGSAAIGTETMVNIGNDVMYMRQGGGIDSLLATQYYGDVQSFDVSRWIPNTVSGLTDAISVYDQFRQKVLFFTSNKVLVLFKDILYQQSVNNTLGHGVSPWSVYKTDHPDGFNTSAVKYMYTPGTTNPSIFFGDSTGDVYDLNGTGGNGDDGTYAISLLRKSRYIDAEVLHPFPYMKENLFGEVQYRRKAPQCTLTVSFDWGDEYNISSSSMALKGPPASDTAVYYGSANYYGSAIYYSQGFQFANKISHQAFSPTGKGPGFWISLSAQTTSAWQVDHLEIF